MDTTAKRKDMKQAVKDLRNLYGNEVDSDEGVVEIDDEDENDVNVNGHNEDEDDSDDDHEYSEGYGDEVDNGDEKPKRRDAFARADGEEDSDSEGVAHLEEQSRTFKGGISKKDAKFNAYTPKN